MLYVWSCIVYYGDLYLLDVISTSGMVYIYDPILFGRSVFQWSRSSPGEHSVRQGSSDRRTSPIKISAVRCATAINSDLMSEDLFSFNFYFFSSPELKAQVSYSDRLLSVVLLSVRLSVNFYIFDFFSRTTGPILTKLGTNHPWGGGDSKLFKWRGLLFSKGR
jgi:hypothetical protein